MLMMAGVNGAFLTGDIFNLYVWFEVFLISSFGLLILGSEKEQIDGATKYAILNLLATALFLVATAYLYGAFGTLNMADIARKADGIRGSAPLMTIAALYLLAFGMKAAAFPVNFWLPASYHTPRIVTAALFGGLLTKVGVYALLRTLVMLFPEQRLALSGLIGWVAIATMILGVHGRAGADRHKADARIPGDIGQLASCWPGWRSAARRGISGTILYAVHSMLAMSALYLLAGAMKEHGGSFSLNEPVRALSHQPAAGCAGACALPGGGRIAAGLRPLAEGDAGQSFASMPARGGLPAPSCSAGSSPRSRLAGFSRLPSGEMPPIGKALARPMRPIPAAPAYGPLIALVIPILVLGMFPEPFIRIADRAAAGLLDAAVYIGAVFPAGGRLMARYLNNILLALVWAALTGSFTLGKFRIRPSA